VHQPPSLRETQEAFEPPAVEAEDGLAVDDGHGRRLKPETDQLLESRRILANVLGRERDPLLRKKLFLVLAGRSAVLRVDDHGLGHQAPPVLPFPGQGAQVLLEAKMPPREVPIRRTREIR
jgi:hypothetical protein